MPAHQAARIAAEEIARDDEQRAADIASEVEGLSLEQLKATPATPPIDESMQTAQGSGHLSAAQAPLAAAGSEIGPM